MQTLYEDLNSKLNNVDRWYIRMPATLLLFPIFFVIVLVLGVLVSIVENIKLALVEFFYPCFFGIKD